MFRNTKCAGFGEDLRWKVICRLSTLNFGPHERPPNTKTGKFSVKTTFWISFCDLWIFFGTCWRQTVIKSAYRAATQGSYQLGIDVRVGYRIRTGNFLLDRATCLNWRRHQAFQTCLYPAGIHQVAPAISPCSVCPFLTRRDLSKTSATV